MSVIRDKAVDKMLQFIRHGYMPESIVHDILTIPELAIVDRKAELPELHGEIYEKKKIIVSEAQQDMLKAGWVKEIKDV